MRVLIVDEDIFATRGGGQTVYRKLICDHPDIEFLYFRQKEPKDAYRPQNCATVPLSTRTWSLTGLPIFFSETHRAALQQASRYADAVKGQAFDLVDAPDYKLFGPYLRDALIASKVRFGGLVHALHGVLSDSIRLDWTGDTRSPLDLRMLELQQFEAADLRYGISRSYAREWSQRSTAPVRVVDPSGVLEPREPIYRSSGLDRPSLLCVGRRERRKGNDVALEIAAWLDPGSFSELRHVGSSSPVGPVASSDDILKRMAEARGIGWSVDGALAPDDLFRVYQDDVVVLAPVRYDTFNLVALEAVALGVPLVVSEQAGVCDYLESLEPTPPFLKIDPGQPAETARRLGKWLADYGHIRAQTQAFASAFQRQIRPLDLRPVYAEALECGRQGRPAQTQSPFIVAEPEPSGLDWPYRRLSEESYICRRASLPFAASTGKRALYSPRRGVCLLRPILRI